MKHRFFPHCWLWLGSLLFVTLVQATPPGKVRFMNETGYQLTELYLLDFDANAPDPENWLRQPLDDGEGITLDLSSQPGCTFDLMAVDVDEDTYVKEDLDLCRMKVVTISLDDIVYDEEGTVASEGQATIYNNGSETIYYLYARAAGTTSWSEDLLGVAGVIIAEESESIAIPGLTSGTCRFDLRAEASGNVHLATLSNVNLCSQTTVRIGGGSTQGGGPRGVTFTNKYGEAVYYLYLRPHGSTDWGADRLGSSNALSNDEAVTIEVAEMANGTCVFDVRGTDLSGNDLVVAQNLNFCQSNAWTIDPRSTGGGSSSTITLTNRYGETIYYLYFRLSGTSDWGADRLGSSNALSADEVVTIDLPEVANGNCVFDIRGMGLDSREMFVIARTNLCENRSVDIIRTGGASGQGNTSTITVRNQSSETIYYLYVAPAGSNQWGDDRLGSSNALSPDEEATFQLGGLGGNNCLFDVRGTDLSKNEVVTLRRRNLCENKTLVFN